MEGTNTLLAWITFWHFAGLGLFSSGFFLSRLELPHLSACNAPPPPPPPFSHPPYVAAVEGEAEVCWGAPRRYDRMVLVVIDALRFDFVFSRDEKPSPFHRHIPILAQTMRRAPERALLYQFEATPPTVTAQRLKGLSTGGLPTFMDMSKNFASPAVHADNIVAQLARAGRRVVFMGDDTWEKLFPPALHFTRSSPFPSFNVKDLNTVDDGCTRLLTGRHPRPGSTPLGGGGGGVRGAASAAASPEAQAAPPPKPELERDDWDVVIAHFLGVDHVGHRFGPNNPAMKTKLEEMNTVLSDVIEMLDERDEKTLLVIIGDHGMTADGNHGGASKLERRSALFMYSGGKGALPFRGQGAAAESAAEATEIAPATPRVVPQVDLLPSLSLILGVPIPFGSLGSILPELFATDRVSPSRLPLQDRVLCVSPRHPNLSLFSLHLALALPPTMLCSFIYFLSNTHTHTHTRVSCTARFQSTRRRCGATSPRTLQCRPRSLAPRCAVSVRSTRKLCARGRRSNRAWKRGEAEEVR